MPNEKTFLVIQSTPLGKHFYGVSAENEDKAIKIVKQIYGLSDATYITRDFAGEPAVYLSSQGETK